MINGKPLFQEYSIPPWLRDRLPLIYVEGEIAAVANIWTCEDFLASKEQYGMIFDWKDNLNNINLLKERTNGFWDNYLWERRVGSNFKF